MAKLERPGARSGRRSREAARSRRPFEAEYKECKAKEAEAEALVEQKLKALLMPHVLRAALDTLENRNFPSQLSSRRGGPEAKNVRSSIRWKSYLSHVRQVLGHVWKRLLASC